MSSPAPSETPLFPPDESDDQSSHGHRQLIGYLGLLLPLSIWVLAGNRPTPKLEGWELLTSISAYYYTGAVAVFTGILGALAAFLFTYRGYDNKFGLLDRIAGVIAGVAAVLVAAFPTEAPHLSLQPSWWAPAVGTIHGVSASTLFLDFAFFSLFLFTKSNPQAPAPGPMKRARNGVYIFCGVAMVICIAWAGIVKLKGQGGSIFWPEALALEFFALSWLAKGRAIWTAAALARRTLRAPGQIIAKVRGALRGKPEGA